MREMCSNDEMEFSEKKKEKKEGNRNTDGDDSQKAVIRPIGEGNDSKDVMRKKTYECRGCDASPFISRPGATIGRIRMWHILVLLDELF